eukprot:Gb_03663 [translate_table: standard]
MLDCRQGCVAMPDRRLPMLVPYHVSVPFHLPSLSFILVSSSIPFLVSCLPSYSHSASTSYLILVLSSILFSCPISVLVLSCSCLPPLFLSPISFLSPTSIPVSPLFPVLVLVGNVRMFCDLSFQSFLTNKDPGFTLQAGLCLCTFFGRLVKLLDWGEEQTKTEAEVAAVRASFRQEVAVWHTLEHPNVTKFVGASMGSSELIVQSNDTDSSIQLPANACCVVVEYLAGGTLKSYLIKNRKKKLAFNVVIQLALDLSGGLSYLHSKKIVHRDVKTENMLLDKNRTLKIADFGVARVEAQNPKDMTGETGTLGYMAPESFGRSPIYLHCQNKIMSEQFSSVVLCSKLMPYMRRKSLVDLRAIHEKKVRNYINAY